MFKRVFLTAHAGNGIIRAGLHVRIRGRDMGEISADRAGQRADPSALGSNKTANELFPLVYEQLRILARRRMEDEKAGHTLQPTALVHEVFLRLAGRKEALW